MQGHAGSLSLTCAASYAAMKISRRLREFHDENHPLGVSVPIYEVLFPKKVAQVKPQVSPVLLLLLFITMVPEGLKIKASKPQMLIPKVSL